MKINLKEISFGIAVACRVPQETIYIWFSQIMNKTYDLPFTSLEIPTDSASGKEG